MNAKLDRWREALESMSFKINLTKTEYIDCNFSGHIERVETTMRIEDDVVPPRDSSHYLCSIISKDDEIDEDV